jgi:hypothetical protein
VDAVRVTEDFCAPTARQGGQPVECNGSHNGVPIVHRLHTLLGRKLVSGRAGALARKALADWAAGKSSCDRVLEAVTNWNPRDDQGATGRDQKKAVVDLLHGVQAGEYGPDWEARAPVCLRQLLLHLAASCTSDTALIPDHATFAATCAWLAAGGEGAAMSTATKTVLEGGAAVLCAAATRTGNRFQVHPVPESLQAVIKQLCDLWRRCIGDVPAIYLTDGDNELAARLDRLAVYHHWPRLGHRGYFSAFEKPSGRSGPPPRATSARSAGARSAGVDEEEIDDMTKCMTERTHDVRMGQRVHSPGIMVMTCMHGVPYGFHFMKRGESPSEIFTVMLTRMRPEHLPRVFIYDNGCKLYECVRTLRRWGAGGP